MLKIELSSCKEKNKEKKLRSFVIFFVYIVLSKGPAIIYFVTYQQKNKTLQGQWKYQCKDQKITNNLRDHPFKTSANFHDFWPLPPGPLPSAFQQNAYEGDFRSLCTVTFWPSAHGDTPPPLRHADVLNGWSLRRNVKSNRIPCFEFNTLV